MLPETRASQCSVRARRHRRRNRRLPPLRACALALSVLRLAPAAQAQQAFRAPNMTPAGMERAYLFCDALGDSVTAAVRQAFDAQAWKSYQTQIATRTLKALTEQAPKAAAGKP